VLRLPSSWIWDFWVADDGEEFHLFFLKASRALIDPDRRHWRATVGHATSVDLINWTEREDALVPADSPAFDDLATWTGSVVRGDDGRWRMFYTAVDRAGGGLQQRISSVISDDLYVWTREPGRSVLEPDPRWYETVDTREWPDQAWRDPWVFRAPDGWHMLITARSNDGPADDRGVIGHAISPDLRRWEIQPPLSAPGAGFGQTEVLQVEVVDGRPIGLFSCLGTDLSGSRRGPGRGGIWAFPADSVCGPFDLTQAYRISDERLYVGRLVCNRDGDWKLLAFRNDDGAGSWVGEIIDPLTVSWKDGRIVVAGVEDRNLSPGRL
jgi:beta-fructofuranosidase